MDKSGFTNNNINKKSKKYSNPIYLIIKNNQDLTKYDADKNFINIALNFKKSNITPNSLYYWPWSSINSDSITAINNSITIKLANIILQNIEPMLLIAKFNKSLSSDFYRVCTNNLLNMFNDNELLLLYLKQLVLILRNSSIFFDNPNEYSFTNNSLYGNVHLYLKMLNSFWNKMNWALLFPSMPETAINLMKNKKLLINLLLRKNDKFRIDKIANKFFKTSDLGRENDILLISFLDFGIFTWLDHFGIINYLNGNDMDPVYIEVTKHGRRMLEYLALG
jgi:hypothetical protein